MFAGVTEGATGPTGRQAAEFGGKRYRIEVLSDKQSDIRTAGLACARVAELVADSGGRYSQRTVSYKILELL